MIHQLRIGHNEDDEFKMSGRYKGFMMRNIPSSYLAWVSENVHQKDFVDSAKLELLRRGELELTPGKRKHKRNKKPKKPHTKEAKLFACSLQNKDLEYHKDGFVLWTDGSCVIPRGGWAFILRTGNQTILEGSGRNPKTTVNRMEMTAALEGLRKLSPGSKVLVISDSQILIRCASKEWKRKKNLDIWSQIDEVAQQMRVTFKWIRGHTGNEFNERCDYLCSASQENELDMEFTSIVG